MAKRKTKAQKEAELEATIPETASETEVLGTEDDNVSEASVGVEAQTKEQSEVQDDSVPDTNGEQPKEALVETPRLSESKGVLNDSKPQETVSTAPVGSENPKTVGIPLMEVPIKDLPGFEVGSKRNPNDPHEVRTAREALKLIREYA